MDTHPVSRRASIRAIAAAPFAWPAAGAQVARTGGGYIATRKVRMWENTRKEFREAVESGALKAVILPTGSTEQHNEHLEMFHDTASVTLVAELAALRMYPGVLVATPVPVGISPHWMDRKGTLTLSQETFLAVVYEICASLKTHGVRNILVLNGHGGNEQPLMEALPGFREKLGINLDCQSYWAAYSPEVVRKYMASNRCPGHAAEFETSFAMAAFPERIHWEGVDYASAARALRLSPGQAREDAAMAREAKLATTAKGEAMLAIAVEWVASRIAQMWETRREM